MGRPSQLLQVDLIQENELKAIDLLEAWTAMGNQLLVVLGEPPTPKVLCLYNY